MATVRRTNPNIHQVAPTDVLGTALDVEVTYTGDNPVTFTMDPATAATVMAAIRHYAVEQENQARATQARGGYSGHYASASHRLRTVEDAYTQAQFKVHGPMPTYDLD